MRRANRIGLGVLAGVMAMASLGCAATPSTTPMPKLASAPEDVGGASIYVTMDTGKIPSDYYDAEDYQRDLPIGVRRVFTSAGYAVVEDAKQPHDLEARIVLDEFKFGFRKWNPNNFSATMLVHGGGKLITRVQVSLTEIKNDTTEASTRLGTELLNRLHATPQFMAYAKERNTPKTAVASAAPAPAPAASPDAANAPSPSPAAGLVAASPQPGAYAFVVGIETYRDVPPAPGAKFDAERFAEVARKTLGLPESHVRVALENHATRTDILAGFRWLKENAAAGSRAYFFFSGHGAPAVDQSTYLLPYDGDAKDVPGTAVSMADAIKQLEESKAKEVLAFVDACFSGAGGRSVLPPGARPLMRVKEATPQARLALFTASQGDEISGLAPSEKAGVFTKYVTLGLGSGSADANGDGQISFQELSDWVSPRVARDAKRDGREQHPKLVVGGGAGAEQLIVEYGLPTK